MPLVGANCRGGGGKMACLVIEKVTRGQLPTPPRAWGYGGGMVACIRGRPGLRGWDGRLGPHLLSREPRATAVGSIWGGNADGRATGGEHAVMVTKDGGRGYRTPPPPPIGGEGGCPRPNTPLNSPPGSGSLMSFQQPLRVRIPTGNPLPSPLTWRAPVHR